MSSPVLPGRLGSPEMSLRDDPRADPRMIAAMEPFGSADRAAPAPVDASSSLEDLLDFVSAAEEGFEALFGAVVAGLPDVEGVERSVEVIKGLDGNDVTVYIHRPADRPDALPGVLHLHGGGMVMLEAAGATYGRLPRRARGVGPRRRRRRVPQRRRQARPSPVPGRSQRLRRGAALGHRPQGEPRHRQAHRRGGVGRREPHLGDDVAGQARRAARPRRRRLRDVPLHLELLGVAGCRAHFAVRERRVLPRRVDDGRARQGVRPVRRSRLRSAGLATVARAPTTSPACLPT